ncbi:MAG: nitrate transporter substrate-binding protein [Burkholderiales bacterium]|nr:nitrate transporter substrate-binding protein [Burkholderiales bacterium]
MRRFLIAAAATAIAAPAAAQQRIDFILNWVPGGDHAPYYYAKKLGWYKGIKDFPGKKIGNPAADGARTMWPALAKANGIDPKSVTWVNIDANAKLAALKARTIDVTTSFYNIHHIFKRELGNDMGFLAWRDIGLNPYGNSVIVNADYLNKNRALVEKFASVTQRAFAECVKQPRPCVQALIDANGALSFDNELVNWQLVEVLMSDKISQTVALGWHDDKRMQADYALVRDYIGIDKPFDVKNTYTNAFLDKSIKMKAVKAD